MTTSLPQAPSFRPGSLTPGEAAFRVWYVYCAPQSMGPNAARWAAAAWANQMPVVHDLWERIAAAAMAQAAPGCTPQEDPL